MRRSHHGGAVVGLLAAALVAGAGVGFRRSSPPPARHLPSTGAARSPSRCPAAPGETVETGYVGRDSDLLLANRAVVEQYGRSHASEFGGYQFVAGPPELLRVAFTAHTDQHLADLRAMVPFPDRLDVVSTDHTVVELGSIREQLAIDLSRPQRGDVYDSLSLGWQAVDVGLRAGMEDLALTYAEQFGSGVRITIGSRPYVPAGCGPAAGPVQCATLAGADPAAAGLKLTVVAETGRIAAGEPGKARLLVRNLGSTRFTIDTGSPIRGSLVLPGTADVVGQWTGMVAGVGGGVDLGPGEAGEIGVVFGASRCDGRPGSALPPGRYGLRVQLAPEGGGRPTVLSPETLVTVTANPTPAP